MLWQKNHSLHHVRGPMDTGLDMAGMPPFVQPRCSLTYCLPWSAYSIFWGCSLSVDVGQKGQTAEEPASLRTLGTTRLELILGPL